MFGEVGYFVLLFFVLFGLVLYDVGVDVFVECV